MPSKLLDETIYRHDPLEREAQIIHLLCLRFDKAKQPDLLEGHISEIVQRLKRIQSTASDGMIHK